jgi:hypothetical protein
MATIAVFSDTLSNTPTIFPIVVVVWFTPYPFGILEVRTQLHSFTFSSLGLWANLRFEVAPHWFNLASLSFL